MSGPITTLPESEATRILREAEEKKAVEAKHEEQRVEPKVVEKIVEVYPKNVMELLEKARTEEKQKLYDRIKRAEATESENSALKQNLTTLQDKTKTVESQLDEFKKSSEKEEKKGQKEGFDAEKVKAIIEDSVEAVKTTLQEQIENLRRENDDLKKSRKQDVLALLREKLILEARGRIIPALVPTGPDEEVIRAGAAQAMAEYEQIVKQALSAAPSVVQTSASTVPSANGFQPAAPTPIGRSQIISAGNDNIGMSQSDQLIDNVKNIPLDEYKRKRHAIRAKLREIYSSVNNPMLR